MQYRHKKTSRFLLTALITAMMISSCVAPAQPSPSSFLPTPSPAIAISISDSKKSELSPTPIPSRELYEPGELVAYTAQTGDTLPSLAAHFNTTIQEIRDANPILPANVSTLPPGLPMQIPIYYQPLWGSPFQMIPDSLFINGPEQINFNAIEFVNNQPGWFKEFTGYPSGNPMRGGEIINHVAKNFSISPQVLLAVLEYQTGALSQPSMPASQDFLLGFTEKDSEALNAQLTKAASFLNQGYYGWRAGKLTIFELLDGRLERPDPWQNAATVALQYYYAHVFPYEAYIQATHDSGFFQTYQRLFGDPWETVNMHIPGSLEQPDMKLPFSSFKQWTLTGGPHTAWGEGEPWAALDFAPPGVTGCNPSLDWVTATAGGIIARSEPAIVVLDLDGDGDERTGWVIFYLHMATTDKIQAGTAVNAGDAIGHPSCEGGASTGTHTHLARKYNGEWMIADSAVPFNMEGWIPLQGNEAYGGKLVRFEKEVIACVCSDKDSQMPVRSTPEAQ